MAFAQLSELLYDLVFFFFFQAEDGIRDADVTGVQTCALPISSWTRPAARAASRVARAEPGRLTRAERSASSDSQYGMRANEPCDLRLSMPRRARPMPGWSAADQPPRISPHSR